MSLGPWQIVLIVVLLLIFFGPKRIPALGKSLGEAIRGFQRGLSGSGKGESDPSPTQLSSEARCQNKSEARCQNKDDQRQGASNSDKDSGTQSNSNSPNENPIPEAEDRG